MALKQFIEQPDISISMFSTDVRAHLELHYFFTFKFAVIRKLKLDFGETKLRKLMTGQNPKSSQEHLQL